MDNKYSDYFPYKSVVLEKLQIGLEVRIAREFVDSKDEYIAYKIKSYVWSQDAGKKVVFKYPSDWWQAFKERWFPKWLLDRYRVVYTYKEFVVKATYPDLKIQNCEPVLRLMQTTHSDRYIHE